MYKIIVFCEDSAHEAILKAILGKLAPEWVRVQILNARHGKGKAITELKKYLQQVADHKVITPDAVVVAIDANCKGYNEKKNEIKSAIPQVLNDLPFAFAIPNPHIERWLLIDSKAFKKVFGVGCSAPDQKCERHRYKNLLKEQIRNAGTNPLLGGIEFADDIFGFMDLTKDRLQKSDESLARFINELRTILDAFHKK